MDTFLGIEVGAEVELNDGTLAVEDLTPIKLENKRDLPLWQHLHHFDDSSSDESLDQEYVNFTPSEVKTLEMPSHVTDFKSQVLENDHMEKSIYVLSTAGNIQPGLFYINGDQREDNSLSLNNANSKSFQEQPSQLAPYLEEPLFSCTEVISDFGQLQPYSKDVYMETTLSYEEDSKVNLGKFSYSEARTQRNRSFNPLGKSYKCQRCGRQFGRLYNLEHHICIEMAVGCPQQSSNNVETMNRLEKMCAEAQKELQTLQGQYKKEVASTQPSLSEIQMGIQEPHSESGRAIPASKCTVPCDHNECESRSICSQEFQNSCVPNAKSFALQNLNVLGNTIVVDLSNYSPIFLDENQEKDSANQTEGIIHPQLDQINREWSNLNEHLSFQASEENPFDATNASPEATKIYKCQDCGKVYNTRCSITNHMHWHKKQMMSSAVNPCVEPSLEGQESHGTTHHVNTPTIGLKLSCAKPAQMFICEYCGKAFDRRCSYATHTYWHVKKKDPVTIIPTQEAKQETGQVSVLPIKKQTGDGACTSPVETFTCQCCGRVFNRHCAYVNHSRWHLKEQELLKRVKAGAQTVLVNEEHSDVGNTKNTLDHCNMAFDVDTKKGMSDPCLDDDNVQGYCRLVGQLSLDEQQNLSSCEQGAKKSGEPSSLLPMQLGTNQQPMPEVLESVLELVVGTEEVHEILLSKAGLVFRKAEDYGSEEDVVKDDAQVSKIKLEPAEEQVAGTQLEPAEEQVAGTQLEPAEEQVAGTQLEPAEEQVAGTQLEPAEEQVAGTQLEPAEEQVAGTQLEPAEEQVAGTQLEPAEEQVAGTQLEPAEEQVAGTQLEPAEEQVAGTQLEPAEEQVAGTQLEPAEEQIAGTQLEPAEEQVSVMQLEPAEEQVSVMQLEPAEEQVSVMQLEPAEEQVSVMQLEPAKKEVSLTQLKPAEEQVSVTQLEPAEKRIPGMQMEPAEKRIPAMQMEPAEKRIPAMQMEPAEKRNPAMQMEPAEKRIPAVQMEPAEKRIPAMQMEPAEKRIPGMQLEPAEKRIPGMQLEPAEKRIPGMQLEPAEKRIPAVQMEPAEKRIPAVQMEPAEKRIPAMQMEPAEKRIPGMQLEPAEKRIPGMQLEPAEKRIPGMQLEPAEKRIPAVQMEPAEKRIPAVQMEPAEKRIPAMQMEPAEKQIPGMQSEPARKTYSLQILPSKLAARCLSRPKPPHRCRDCGVRFHQFWRLKQHRLKGFGRTCTLKKHQCDCSRTPIGSLHFLLHQLQHLSDTAFICEVCSKSLRGYRQLQAHSWVHPLVSQFLCKCGTRFTKLPRYLWHSLKNKAKPKTKLHLRGCTRAPL